MALITQADVEARLGRSLTTEEQNAFTIINAANQSYIERMLGSSVESVSASTRYYDGGLQNIVVDPVTSVTSVQYVDADENVIETIDSSDYEFEPRNRTLKTMLRNRYGKFVLAYGHNNIAITGKYSIYEDTDILNIIKDSLIESAVAEVTDTSNIKRESIEGYSVEYASTTTKDAMRKVRAIFPDIL